MTNIYDMVGDQADNWRDDRARAWIGFLSFLLLISMAVGGIYLVNRAVNEGLRAVYPSLGGI